jgi:hypothetical protein
MLGRPRQPGVILIRNLVFFYSPDRGLYRSLATLLSKMRSRNINNNFAVKIGNRGGAFN